MARTGSYGGRGRLPVELEAVGDDAPVDPGVAEDLGLVHRRPVQGVAGGQPHAPVVPRRLRVPLVGEVDPVGGEAEVGLEPEPGTAPEILGEGAAHLVDHVHLAPLQRGQPRGLVGDGLEDEPLHAGGLPPVLLVGLEDQLDPRRERDEPVRARADRGLLEPVVAHALDVLLRHDPPRPGGAQVEGEEVGPRPLQPEADAPGVGRLHRRHRLLERLGRRSPVPLERELHVLRGHGIAVVELDVLPQDELVEEPVRRHGPRLGEAGRHRLARQGLGHGVVHRVERHERRDDPRGLGGIEPRGRERDVHPPRHLAFGRRRRGGRAGEDDHDGEEEPEATVRVSHGECLPGHECTRSTCPSAEGRGSSDEPSFDRLHDSARLGAIALPGMGFTSASWSA